jgi:tRNA (Thr-GGU) A37 N-methylase
MSQKRWSSTKRNDKIVCPATGLPETITRSESRPNGMWFVRTSKHDHYRLAADKVEVQDGK